MLPMAPLTQLIGEERVARHKTWHKAMETDALTNQGGPANVFIDFDVLGEFVLNLQCANNNHVSL